MHHARGHGSFRQASSRLRKAKGLCAPCPRTTTNKLRMTSKPTDFLVIPLFPDAAPWPQTTADGSCKSAGYPRLPRACSARDRLTVAVNPQPVPGCPGHAQRGVCLTVAVNPQPIPGCPGHAERGVCLTVAVNPQAIPACPGHAERGVCLTVAVNPQPIPAWRRGRPRSSRLRCRCIR